MSAESSIAKWPTPIEIVQIFGSPERKHFTLFLLSGVLTSGQYEELAAATDVVSAQEIDGNRFVVSTLLNQEQLEELHATFKPRAKSWRGQYYALSHALVDACEAALEG